MNTSLLFYHDHILSVLPSSKLACPYPDSILTLPCPYPDYLNSPMPIPWLSPYSPRTRPPSCPRPCQCWLQSSWLVPRASVRISTESARSPVGWTNILLTNSMWNCYSICGNLLHTSEGVVVQMYGEHMVRSPQDGNLPSVFVYFFQVTI